MASLVLVVAAIFSFIYWIRRRGKVAEIPGDD